MWGLKALTDDLERPQYLSRQALLTSAMGVAAAFLAWTGRIKCATDFA